MLRILIPLLLLPFLCSAQATDGFHERWILDLDESNFSLLTKQPTKIGFEIKVLSEHFKLVGVHSEQGLSEEQVRAILPQVKIDNIYPDRKLSYRDRVPDDFSYSSQWNMDIIEMPSLWEHATGGMTPSGEDIVVAILDVGYEIDHSDLDGNYWTNKEEIPNDDIDNDDNGYKDDYLGLNIDSQNDTHNIDDHGTKVAGIIGAEGNNGRGVAGISWNVKMMPLGGVDHIGEIIVAMEYVIMMKKLYLESNGAKGANIVATNLSAGVGRTFPFDSPDWCPYYNQAGELGILSVSAAPNENYDVDEEGDLPSLCDSEFLITVTNTDMSDFKVQESGYGKVNIDLGAPGERIFTTNLNDDYGMISGTSASAPHVAGLIGLLYNLDCTTFSELVKSSPADAALFIKTAILEGVDVKSSLANTLTQGRVNAYNTFVNIVSWCTGLPLGNLAMTDLRVEDQQINLRYNTSEFSEHTVTMYDVMGRRLKTFIFNPTVFKEKRVFMDISDLDLSSGNYIFTLSNENERVSNMYSLIVVE